MKKWSVLLLSLCFTHSVVFAHVRSFLPERAIDILTQIHKENPGLTTHPLVESLPQLEKFIPNRNDHLQFLIDWTTVITDLARETTKLHELRLQIGDDVYTKLGARGPHGGNGTFEKWILTQNAKLYKLMNSEYLFLPLKFALTKFSDSDWAEYKPIIQEAMKISQDQMILADKIIPRGLYPTQSSFNVSFLTEVVSNLLLNGNVIQSSYYFPKLTTEEVQRTQMRKMDLLEIAFKENYLTQDQKNEVASNIAEFFRRAYDQDASKVYDQAQEQIDLKKLYAFEPLLSRIKNLGLSLAKTTTAGFANAPEEFKKYIGMGDGYSCRSFYK